MARGTKCKITWGPAFANTLTISIPLDQANTYPRFPSDYTDAQDFPSGERRVYAMRTDWVLEGTMRWTPITDQTVPSPATGWDGTTGVAEFLMWAARGNIFRFFPDAASGTFQPCLLEAPDLTSNPSTLEMALRYRAIALRFRTADGSKFTGF